MMKKIESRPETFSDVTQRLPDMMARDQLTHPSSSDEMALWSTHRGQSPVVATAIHNGHSANRAVRDKFALNSDERLREEDPFTEYTIRDIPNRIIFHHSRFEIDLNRSRDGAVYLTPEQAWSLNVWERELPADVVKNSLQMHGDYYAMLHSYLKGIEASYGKFIVMDVHSYNHRRDGPDALPTDISKAPEINIGTSAMDRAFWAPVVDALIDHMRYFEIDGRRFDVQENVAFQGKGEQTRFIHEHFPQTGCAIAIEFKKFFMDEWTGEPDAIALNQLRALIASCRPVLEHLLREQR